MSSHELQRGMSSTADFHLTPRPNRRNDPLAASTEFTPAKDVFARTASFKRLSGSVTRPRKADLISSVLSKSRVKQPDFQIFVDIPSQLEGNSGSDRGPVPGTPKRSRSDMKDREASFDGLSPIGSPKLCGFSPDFEPQSTPKRRKSSNSLLRASMSDLFSKKRDEPSQDLDWGLSKSFDFSRLASTPSREAFSTPKKRSKSEVTPRAPRKVPRGTTDFEELPSPTRLRFDSVDEEVSENAPVGIMTNVPVDYSGAMGVVGFIASYLARVGERRVGLSELVQLISASSVSHKTATSAHMAVRNLAKAIPEWVSVSRSTEGEIMTFSSELRTFEVLQKLGELKRKQMMEDTSELRASIAELRASVTRH